MPGMGWAWPSVRGSTAVAAVGHSLLLAPPPADLPLLLSIPISIWLHPAGPTSPAPTAASRSSLPSCLPTSRRQPPLPPPRCERPCWRSIPRGRQPPAGHLPPPAINTCTVPTPLLATDKPETQQICCACPASFIPTLCPAAAPPLRILPGALPFLTNRMWPLTCSLAHFPFSSHHPLCIPCRCEFINCPALSQPAPVCTQLVHPLCTGLPSAVALLPQLACNVTTAIPGCRGKARLP